MAAPQAPPADEAPLPRGSRRNILVWTATLAGTGFLPGMPGTWATLIWGVPIGLTVGLLSWPARLAAAAVVFGVSCRVAGTACAILGRRDSPRVVIDELAGYLVAALAAPRTWQAVALAFLLFRFFDVVKPWPVSWADRRVAGGLGVTLDDVLAGAYALVLGRLAQSLWPGILG
jgi:phosphatidylglycerophosphatase A